MSYETILANVKNGVGTLTFNRPEALNALNRKMMEEVYSVIKDREKHPEVRVVVVTGSAKAFAAGADIKEMVDVKHLDALSENFLGDWNCLAECAKPTVAAVSGYALGGGCELAMMCDIILASETAQFGQPEIRIGTMPGLGGTQRLTRLIDKSKAMDLCLTGRLMDVDEAERSGLVARKIESEQLLVEAQKVAEGIAGYSATAVQLARESVQAAWEGSLQQGLQLERRYFYSLFGSADQQEGMRAFSEKRDPVFER